MPEDEREKKNAKMILRSTRQPMPRTIELALKAEKNKNVSLKITAEKPKYALRQFERV